MNHRLFAALLAGAVVADGCSRHPSRLSGKVHLDGKPLTTGVIMLTPVAQGSSAYAAIGPDGRYSIHTGASTGLEPGEYVVTVAANAAAAGVKAAAEAAGARGTLPLITPAEYADWRRSPLRASIRPGSQKIDFDIVSKRKK